MNPCSHTEQRHTGGNVSEESLVIASVIRLSRCFRKSALRYHSGPRAVCTQLE